MNNLKKFALAVGVSALASTSAFASTGDPIISFDSTAIPGAGTGPQFAWPYQFDYDDFLVSDNGATVVTQTDTDNSGTLSAGDAFSEFTVVSTSAFRKDGLNINSAASGVNFEYDLITTLTLGGFVIPNANGTVTIKFTTGTGSMVYDEAPITPGISLEIATLQDPVNGSCTITLANIGNPNAADGACVITFDFDAVYEGNFISSAGDLADYEGDKLRVDINIDEVVGLLELLALGYDGYDDTCGGQTGLDVCSQDISVTHNGSARHVIPTPGTLALMGLGLLGLSRLRGKKQA